MPIPTELFRIQYPRGRYLAVIYHMINSSELLDPSIEVYHSPFYPDFHII